MLLISDGLSAELQTQEMEAFVAGVIVNIHFKCEVIQPHLFANGPKKRKAFGYINDEFAIFEGLFYCSPLLSAALIVIVWAEAAAIIHINVPIAIVIDAIAALR